MPKKSKFEVYQTMFASKALSPSAYDVETIPVGNLQKVQTLFGDMEPLEFVNEVLLGADHPTDEWSGKIVLTKEWAESFAKAINKVPGFLYAKGHEDTEPYKRAIASGYIVGAKIDGERLLLRNRLIPKTSPDGKEFVEQTMREVNAGVLSTSTGDMQKRRIEFDDEGNYTQFAIESMRNQTNALVEHDMHASDASIVSSNFRIGYYDEKGNLIQEDISKFKDTTGGGDNRTKGEGKMTFKEYIEGIKTSLKSGEGDIATVLAGLNVEVLTEEHKTQLSKLKDAETKAGVDIVTFVDTVLSERTAMFADNCELKLKNAFKDEDVLELAREHFSLKSGDSNAIDEEITRITKLKSVQKMQTLLASAAGYVPSGNDGVNSEGTKSTSTVMEV
jgi:hypothetical protein